jgi:hypothetical protein
MRLVGKHLAATTQCGFQGKAEESILVTGCLTDG